MPRVLLSVTDKTGIAEFAAGLKNLGFEVISTGGTAKALREAGIDVLEVSDITSFPEILEGRVKTLHPKIHGGLLGDRTKPHHVEQMAEFEIEPIEILAVNLYAFEQTVSSEHEFSDAVESIDIGGPAMIRAAAKNYESVAVVVDPEDYGTLLEAVTAGTLADLRTTLMAKAFRHTAYYDAMIARYLTWVSDDDHLAEIFPMPLKRVSKLRYGENPHQRAALYRDPFGVGVASGNQLWGIELSYNNLLDADAAWGLACDLPQGACAIIKHGNPCGAAVGSNLADSYRLARATDTISAFGGIAALHGVVDLAAAEAMTEKGNFLEVVVAVGFEEDALDCFMSRSGWGQNVRLLAAPIADDSETWTVRTIRGGVLVQEADVEPEPNWKVVTDTQPTANQWAALRLQWTIAKHVKSNAIVIGLGDRMLGVGAGQMNRVQSVRLALEQAGDSAEGACLASDAFFPFPDSVETAAVAGISSIIQPGGSKKDTEVIEAANRLGISMVFTGVRHFRH